MAEFLMTSDQVRRWLDTEWESAREDGGQEGQHVDSSVDLLVNSRQRESQAVRLDECRQTMSSFSRETP